MPGNQEAQQRKKHLIGSHERPGDRDTLPPACHRDFRIPAGDTGGARLEGSRRARRFAVLQTLDSTLRQIDAALARLHAGGTARARLPEPIPLARLQAVPSPHSASRARAKREEFSLSDAPRRRFKAPPDSWPSWPDLRLRVRRPLRDRGLHRPGRSRLTSSALRPPRVWSVPMALATAELSTGAPWRAAIPLGAGDLRRSLGFQAGAGRSSASSRQRLYPSCSAIVVTVSLTRSCSQTARSDSILLLTS